METRQGKIDGKLLKFTRDKAPYATFTIDGKNYNSFDKKIIDNHNPDDFVEFTGEMEGKFWTLKTMKKIDETKELGSQYDVGLESADAQAKDFDKALHRFSKNGKEYHLSPEEVKCRALECALNCRIKGFELNESLFGTQELLALADKFVEWIRNGN